jgi:hypothetical protein
MLLFMHEGQPHSTARSWWATEKKKGAVLQKTNGALELI